MAFIYTFDLWLRKYYILCDNMVEISARDIRVRLYLHENENYLKSGNSSETDTMRSSHAEGSITPKMISNAKRSSSDFEFEKLPTLLENSTTIMQKCSLNSVDIFNNSFAYAIPKNENCASLKINVFIKGITLTLISDLNSINSEINEVINAVCDDIVLTITETQIIECDFSISEVQLDNQLHSQGSFDFPVILIGQEIKPQQQLASLNTPIQPWIKFAKKNPIISIKLNVESWMDIGLSRKITKVRDVKINIQPLSIYIEDSYIMQLMDYLLVFMPTKLMVLPKRRKKINYSLNSMLVGIPERISWESMAVAQPLILQNFTIEPISLLLSIHSSIKLYIALDQSPLQFAQFERKNLMTTSYRLGHGLTMHYLSGAIFGAGWVVGSLELLGSPGGLARAMGTGLKDFINMPYQGFIQGPWAFLRGVTHGSASLMKHITAGTLQSVTKLASSVARNLDRMSLDDDHFKRTEEQRRQRPQGVAQGFLQGLTGLGISLLGAVGGIAHHPIQSVMIDGASPRSLAAGVGLGLVGAITKPLSGAADLLALTGQGLLEGAGWDQLPKQRNSAIIHHTFSNPNSVVKYNWKYMHSGRQNVLFVTDATYVTNEGEHESVALILTTEALIIINTDEDIFQRIFNLSEINGCDNISDPMLLSFKLVSFTNAIKYQQDNVSDMDPACRARVVDYVRSTVGLLQFPEDTSPDTSEMNISPCPTPTNSATIHVEQTVLTFYVNPQNRDYFLTLLALAKQQQQNYSFPIL